MVEANTSVRPRRFRRFAVRFSLVLLVLLAVIWFLPAIVANTGLKRMLIADATGDLNGKAEVESLSLGWLSPVEMRGISVLDTEGRPVLTVERASTERTLLQLLRDRATIGKVTVEKPVISATFAKESSNVESMFAKYLADDGEPSTGNRSAINLEIVDGEIQLIEGDQNQKIQNVNGVVEVPSSRTESVKVALTAKGLKEGRSESLDLAISVGDALELDLRTEDFSLDSVGPAIRRFAPGTRLGGRLTAKVNGTWGKDASGLTKATVEGTTRITNLDLNAPWLGEDRVRMERAELPGKVMFANNELRVERTKLTCDVGEISADGIYRIGESFDEVLARPGVQVAAEVDLAKLAAIIPRAMKLKEGTALQKGQISARLASRFDANGVAWDGSIRTTSIEGTRNGQRLVWDQPLRAEFIARRKPDGLPEFDKLECQSDFIGLAARGNVEQFVAAANLNLDRLTARLADFIDLEGRKFEGVAAVAVRVVPRPARGSTLTASAKFTRFAITDSTGRGLRESELAVSANAEWVKRPDGTIRLETAIAAVTVGVDQLSAKLLEPVDDLKSYRSCVAEVRIDGDFSMWWGRLGAFVRLPRSYELGGTGTLVGKVRLTADGATAERATATLANARFRGAGLVIDEKSLVAVADVAWAEKSGEVTLTSAKLSSVTAGISSDRIDFRPTADGYGVVGRANVTADANRVQRILQLQVDPKDEDAVHGLAKGTVVVDSTKGPVAFEGDIVVERFSFGPLAKPTWQEPSLKLTANGEYEFPTDGVRLRSATLEREGLSVKAAGSVLQIGTTQDLNLDGTLTCDFAKLQPEVREFLGKDGRITGQGSKPFQLAGRLGGKDVPAAVTVARPKATLNDTAMSLNGSAAVDWQSIRAHGFDVGPATLQAKIDRGLVTANPVAATFGGGKVRLEPMLDLNATDLSFAKGRIVERARLTPEACAQALGYALPAIANAAKADGLLSFDLDENRIPLLDTEKATVAGKLTLHNATISPGPVVTQITTLLGVNQPTLTLASEQVVPIRLEKGRVHHENFALTLGQSTVKTSGSVGLDGTLLLVLDLPLPQKVIESALAKNPKIRDVILKHRIKVPLAGTLAKPQIDGKAFEVAVQDVLRTLAKDAAQSAADDFLKKGQDKLLQELQKKLGQPLKK